MEVKSLFSNIFLNKATLKYENFVAKAYFLY